MRHGRFWLAFVLFSLSPWGIWSAAQAPSRTGDDAQAEEAKEKAIAERFRKVLETNPRRGTALDRLYGHHVEYGTLDKLIGEYAARTKSDAKDGVAWMIVGLLESQRGKDAAAVAAFKQAEANLPDNAMPPYYLGQSLVLVGQPDAAADAFERAIQRKPNRADLLDVFQALGRVYQRAQKTEQALAVWTRLEQQFPDDLRVQEQIATTLAEEGQFEQALPRFERLAKAVKDAYRQSAFRIEAAELKVRLKRSPQALADFEGLLGELNPESWLYRDVRRKIEEVFLRSDDLAGLAKYYDGYLAKHADDIDVMARLARTLASAGRIPESREWLKKALEKAPTRRELRQAMIDQFVHEQKFADAVAQFEAMDKAEPNNPDTLRDWGKMLLRDTARPEPDRKQAALTVWKRLLDRRKDDPVATAQVADLVRGAGLTDEAIALYRKAIDYAPNAPQYREYLGEYLHNLKRKDEALAAWRPIADGANRNAKNLARLAEVFAGFGYRTEAIATIADALTLEKDDFNLTLRYADLLHQDQQYDAALKQLDGAGKLTNSPEDVEQVLVAQIKNFQAMDKLLDQIAELQKDLNATPNAPADRWLRLARYYEANRQSDRATETITKTIDASNRDPQRSANSSIAVLTAAARIYESGGDLLAAADTNRKLAATDRRFRTEYLTAVARLEQRLGRREQALQAGRELLAAAPGNPDVYKFFADLCFQVGDQDEGFEALRKSVRANPSDPQGLIALGTALAERVRQGEAIELFWRAFDKTNELDGKLSLIDRITHLYLENNQFDRLMERLERERREADKQREMTLCIAQAYTTAGDLGTARQQLERLLTENTRDTHLLNQLVTLCDQEGDVAAAVKYQRQLNAAAPENYDHRLKLAQLLTRTGEADEAAEIWIKLVSGQTEPHRNLTAIDQLISANKYDSALAILSRMLAQNPGNWELLYREGAALAARGNTDEATARFNALLTLKLPDDEYGEILKFQIKQAKRKAATPGATSTPALSPALAAALASGTLSPAAAASVASRYDESSMPPVARRTARSSTIRMAVGMDVRSMPVSIRAQASAYGPQDYGEARMAALGWLYEFARAKEGADAFVRKLKDAAATRERERADADTRPLWDWYYLQMLRIERQGVFGTALALSQGNDPAGMLVFLQQMGSRGQPSAGRIRRVGEEVKDNTPPLSTDQLAHALTCYRRLKQLKPEWVNSAVTQMVMTELKRAKKEDDEKALYQELVKEANTVSRVVAALALAANRNELETCFQLFGRLEKLQPPVKTSAAVVQLPTRQAYSSLLTLMGRRADAKQFAEARLVLDLYLTTVRRQNLLAPRSGLSSRSTRTFASVGPSSIAGRRGAPIAMSIPMYSSNQTARRGQITYPSANEYYDSGSIYLLYNAFDMHKRADLVSDLFAHVRKQLGAAQGAEKLYLHLAIAYLHWWSEEKDEAMAELTRAIESAPGEHNLVLEVAALREQNSEFEAALALLDSITPLDTQMMQRREDAALRVAERTGNLDRARQAADRLFGLRLDADRQVDLAGKMHRLGMHDLAETVLGRAQRQAGNRTATLVQLMTQYQSQNQADLAAQIARQILRRGPSSPGGSGPIRGFDETDTARSQAIGVLARSGQLKEMIERAEAQLKTAPKSVQLYQALVDYYQASGDKEKLKAAVLQMAELRPDDGKLRFQAAQQLQQQGERDAAIFQYKAAIKLDPSLFGNRYYEVQSLFAQANKMDELAQLLDEIDLRKVGSYYTITSPIADLMRNDKSRDVGVKLFKKAWEAFPQYRSSMLSELYDESLWRLPEIYTFARQAVIPREDSDFDPWSMISDYMSYGQEGRIDGVITRMLAIARKQQRLPELRAEVQAALIKRPDWLSGKALLAILDIQSGNKEAGKKEWKELFADPKLDMPAVGRFILCQELEYYAGVEELAVKTLEDGIDDLFKEGRFQFSYHPARRLVWWYEQLGRKEDARKLTLRFAKPERSESSNVVYPPGYMQYQTVSSGISVAQEMLRVGDPVEAVRVYSQLLADRETLDLANQYYRGGSGRFDQQIEQGLKNALKALKPSTLPAAVGALLTPRDGAPANGPVLDLIVLVDSRDLGKATLTSVFASAFESTAKAPDVRKDALARLADLVQKHPTDYSVQIAAALTSFAEGDAAGIREAVERLVKLTESAPLDALPPNAKPNARQRAEAQQQVPLWLIARECLRKDRSELWPAGDKLAARASAAAKRQPDTLLTCAVLGEWARIALDRGDRVQAEARLSEILEMALPKPDASKRPAAAPSRGRPAPVPLPPPPVPPGASRLQSPTRQGGPSPPAVFAVAPQSKAKSARGPVPARPPVTRGNVPVPTADQFQQAYDVAMLAADMKLPAVSLRAMREAVRGGPPIAPTNQNQRGGRLMSRTINGVQYYVEETGEPQRIDVDQALVNLVPKWRAIGVSPVEVYDVLTAAVLPAARPAEVFLYAEGRPLGRVYLRGSSGALQATNDVLNEEGTDRGLGRLLADVAVEAGKTDDLRTRAEARAGQPLGELTARILLLTLALKANDQPRAAEVFKALGERLRKDTQPATNDRVTAVMQPAFADPRFAELLVPFIEKAAENYANANNIARATELRLKLAEHHLGRKDEAAARAQCKTVEAFAQRVARNAYDVHLPLARQYLKFGWTADALREVGLHADSVTAAGADPRMRTRRAEPTVDEFPRLVRLLLQMPAAERYDALKTWSLPTAGRKSVRYLIGTTPKHAPPPQFVKLPPVPLNEVVSTMTLLADAARDSGKFDELVAEADKLAGEKIENAELLRALVYAVGGERATKPEDREVAVKAFADTAHKRLTTKPEQPVSSRYYYDDGRQSPPVHPSEFLFATLCLGDPRLVAHGERLLGPMLTQAQNTQANEYASRIRAAWDRLGATRAGAADALVNAMPSRWFNATARSVWFAQDGYLVQAWNDQPSYLLFDTPLTGTFEFSVDTYVMPANGGIGYAGVVCDPNDLSRAVAPVSHNETIYRTPAGLRPGQFNRLTAQVSPGKWRCLVNGQLFFEDTDAPATSPWVMLASHQGGRPVFRSFSLTGQPRVPAEVKLTDGDSLGGWMTHLYGGSMPQRLRAKEPVAAPQYYDDYFEPPQPDTRKERVYDWHAKGGELFGRKLAQPGDRPVPSKLAYFRPLRAAETLRYEFFYEPGRTHVYPSLGRLAFLLEPDGVRLHWLTETPAEDWTGLAVDNAVDDAARKIDKLPLKVGDWNSVTLVNSLDAVKIDLNSVTVYEAKLTPEIERLFGFFHYRDRTAVRVRNVVLTGSWPKTFEPVGFATAPASPAEAKARRWQLGERYYFAEAGEVVARAKPLPARERFQALADWALPRDSRPSFQLAGVSKPLDVLGDAISPKNSAGNASERRVLYGSRFEAPCLEMIAAAKEAGALDVLAERVMKLTAPANDDLYRRCRLAMLAVVRAAQGKDADAADALKQLRPFAEKMKPDAHGPERWPDLIAVLGTLDRPALLSPALDLADVLIKNLDQTRDTPAAFEDRDWWARTFRTARAKAEVLAQADWVRRPFGSDANFLHWASVSGIDAGSRGSGAAPPHWVYQNKIVKHLGGHSDDYLVFRTPLRGDFEVSCELRIGNLESAHVRYGGYQFDLGADRKAYKLHTTVRNNGRDVTITPQLPAANATSYQFRLAVKDGWLRAFVDGRELAAEKLSPDRSPWLMVHSSHLSNGDVRDFKVSGAPTVPDTIDMLDGDELAMWRPYLGQFSTGDQRFYGGNFWMKRGEEMYAFGRKPPQQEDGRPEPTRLYVESAVYYQRPLLEDGVVEYEFFHDPDRAHCHPMLDRLVFLLEPEGVRLHWLTDGALEKSGIPFDNATDEPTCRRGPSRLPLNPRAWNKVRLAVAGDSVKLALNGVEVYERPIEPTNQRLFGIFHYADRSEARVRSMTHTGAWPKQLPANDKLFEVKRQVRGDL